ncbi:putative chemotaxis protein CheY [Methylocella tundrae]|jgi:two-component system chemotaxis response regulator CheY|uniref:Putative chemotaxis protein CheY n=1 Tax=Methylocella tundrae TaxID=227605 RepID=A0A4U8Z1D1_METTU|nr:response regulator [Methylocella tundrae]WPP03126.1 response regulator [Methylocella tundrae]VFU09099.1 putative chemotaxis protein CheY [Methylocella tundrae]VTZ24951.1 putative chemotaxis protein CheY [Methylocella tundrae]VTZ50444.1 putative chemotaxis protein CheY [Methylocella tundrae]
MPFAAALRVLIVDDQLTSRLLIRGGLQELGVSDIEMAADGEQGFKSMMAKPAHLVISDFNMPKMDGIAFLRAVRSYEPTRRSAFILLTGRGDKELIERAQKCGVNNVIAKPFTIPVLKAQIEAVVGKLK